MAKLAGWLSTHSLDIAIISLLIWYLNYVRHQPPFIVNINQCPITEKTPPSMNEMFHI